MARHLTDVVAARAPRVAAHARENAAAFAHSRGLRPVGRPPIELRPECVEIEQEPVATGHIVPTCRRAEGLDEASVTSQREDFERARVWIDKPVLANAERRVVALLLDAVAPVVAWRRGDHLDDDVRRCLADRRLETWTSPEDRRERPAYGLVVRRSRASSPSRARSRRVGRSTRRVLAGARRRRARAHWSAPLPPRGDRRRALLPRLRPSPPTHRGSSRGG